MRIVQHNCQRNYAVCQATFQVGLDIGAEILCLQEPYLGEKGMVHPAYEFRFSNIGETRQQRVAVGVRKDIQGRIVVESRSDIIEHPYIQVLDVWELDIQKKKKRKSRIVNVYDNWIGEGQPWTGNNNIRRRAIEDVNWDVVIESRTIIVGDFNAHSPYWNPTCQRRQRAAQLEFIIDKYGLLINNDMTTATRPKQTPGCSIIDLTLTTPDLGFLHAWTIDPEYATPSDHELISFDLENLNGSVGALGPSNKVTGWDIKNMTEDQEQMAYKTWKELADQRIIMNDSNNKAELDEEAQWISDTLILILDQHVNKLKLCARSKRWWSKEINELRSSFKTIRRQFQRQYISLEEYKVARNAYYRQIRKSRDQCFEKWIQGEDINELFPPDSNTGDTQILQRMRNEDSERCWKALKYTKEWKTTITPALKNQDGVVAVTIEEKEAMIRLANFPPPPTDDRMPPERIPGTVYKSVNNERVRRALYHQSVKKAPGPDRLNFHILRLVWKWDSNRITALIRQCIRQGHHPHAWRTAKGVLLRKPNKIDHSQVKSYRVISLLNCLGKVAEKVVADLLSEWCESSGKLHQGQMGSRKQRSCIDAVARVMNKVEEIWRRGNIAALLLMDVKGAFDHVSRCGLLHRLVDMGADGNLIAWVESFLTDRRLRLVIDGHEGDEVEIESGVPQGSPVSPILFAIYLSGVFENVETNVNSCFATSFADDCGFLVEAENVPGVVEKLQEVGCHAINWGTSNLLQFDHGKTEAVVFTKKRKLRAQIRNSNIQIGGHLIKFNNEATRWLGFWLDSALNFRYHKEVCIQKARRAEARLRSIVSKKGLSPGLVRRIQIAAVQAVALYGAELWWRNQKTWEQEYQKLVNRQSRTVTGMFRDAPTGVLVKEAGLQPAKSLLNNRQRRYAQKLLALPNDNTLRSILPETLRDGDAHVQPGEQEPSNWDWISARNMKNLGQRLANSLVEGTDLDTSFGIEYTERLPDLPFPGKIVVLLDPIEAKKKALDHHDSTSELSFWSDGSRLENRRTGTGIVWKTEDGHWHTRKIYLGKNKEIFDAELYGIDQALNLALRAGRPRARPSSQVTRQRLSNLRKVYVWLDSRSAINRIKNLAAGPGQWLARRIYDNTRTLLEYGINVEICWIPGHAKIEGNERADRAAKEAAENGQHCLERFASLSYISGLITERKWKESRIWFIKEHRRREAISRDTYKLTHTNQSLDPIVARSSKPLSSRYYQLKSNHAFTGAYLYRINKVENNRCMECSEGSQQTVSHLMLNCRKWRRERDVMWSQMRRDGSSLRKGRIKVKELFGDKKATRAILQFLKDTDIGVRRNQVIEDLQERERRENIGIGNLDENEENPSIGTGVEE